MRRYDHIKVLLEVYHVPQMVKGREGVDRCNVV